MVTIRKSWIRNKSPLTGVRPRSWIAVPESLTLQWLELWLAGSLLC